MCNEEWEIFLILNFSLFLHPVWCFVRIYYQKGQQNTFKSKSFSKQISLLSRFFKVRWFPTDSHKKLAERLKKGSEKAFEEIIYRFTPLVSNIIKNISCGYLSNEDIEEVTTDVFVTLWKNADKLDVNLLKPYIICIAKSRAKDRLRRENHFETVDIDSIDIQDDSDILENCENQIRYYYYYQPVRKIAEITGINIETVKSKLQRTRKKLKDALINRGYWLWNTMKMHLTKLWKAMSLTALSPKKSWEVTLLKTVLLNSSVLAQKRKNPIKKYSA